MENTKLFPVDYSTDEIRTFIKAQINALNNFLPEGEKQKAEREITIGQNQLVALSNIESNQKLQNQHTILTNILNNFISAERNATKLTMIVIILTLLTLLATTYLEIMHMKEENNNQKEIITLLKEANKQIEMEKQLLGSLIIINDSCKFKKNHQYNGNKKYFKN